MKTVQWFKFCPAKWVMGRTRKLTPEQRDEYLDLCCSYWTANCNMSTEDIRLNCDSYEVFIKRALVTEEGIEWLNAQYDEIAERSKKLKEAGRKGAKAKSEARTKPSISHSLAYAKQGLSQTAAEKNKKRKETEEEEEKNKKRRFNKSDFISVLLDLGCDKVHVEDWVEVRKQKKLSLTRTALNMVVAECNKNNYPVAEAIKICASNSWGGFKYEWLNKQNNGKQITEGREDLAQFIANG